ncbi:Disintegrin and metalloproteinase domain-containing protein 12, partial [Allomyces javanicus]
MQQLSIELEGLGDDPKFLHLQLNRDLIGRNYMHIMGDTKTPAHTIHKKRSPNCYNQGSVAGDAASLAALSLCDGMHGVIHFNETHRYTIRPDAAASPSMRQARDPDAALARPHQLIRDSGAEDGSGAAAANHHFCNHKTIDDVDQQLDEQIRVEAERMRRDASALRSVAVVGGGTTLKRRGLETNKVVEMMVVSDYERYQAWGNQTELSILVFVNYVDLLLRGNKILPEPYTLRATLAGTYTATSPMWAPSSNATVNEIHVQFCQWRRDRMADPTFAGTFVATNDHAQLLTGRSLGGVSWVSGMCYSLYSCSVAPGVKIPVMAGLGMGMTHEIAHNLGAYHDSMGTSTCNSTDFIMNPYYCGSCQQQPAAFSNCSINEMRTVLGSRATCLDTIASPLFGNGLVDPGEECDSGDPFHGSACCTAQCTWRAGAVCDDTKDVAEYCTGTSPVCPADTVLHPGTACTSRAGNPGRCARGTCRSDTDVCTGYGLTYLPRCDGTAVGYPCRIWCVWGDGRCMTWGDLRADGTLCMTGNVTGVCLDGNCASNTTRIGESALCGNGVLDPDEECDPGNTITGTPCCQANCRLRPGAVCDASLGPCCTPQCQFADNAIVCREPARTGFRAPCDVADYCP